MIWQTVAPGLSIIGVISIYLTNKHQRFFAKPVHKHWRLVGYLCWLLSFISWLQIYVMSAAFFVWLFTLSTVLICIPFLSLISAFEKISLVNDGDS